MRYSGIWASVWAHSKSVASWKYTVTSSDGIGGRVCNLPITHEHTILFELSVDHFELKKNILWNRWNNLEFFECTKIAILVNSVCLYLWFVANIRNSVQSWLKCLPSNCNNLQNYNFKIFKTTFVSELQALNWNCLINLNSVLIIFADDFQ